jgi:diguanylate cyclase (GGDEF)-like protein/PAS domain S-box-containing protein
VTKLSFMRRLSRVLAPIPLKRVLVTVFLLQMLAALGLLGFLTIAFGHWLIAVVGLVVIAGAMMAGLAVVQRIFQPINQLTTAARAMARGNWQTPLPTDRFDELGELATAFNNMAAQLQGSLADLENLNQALQRSERRWRQFLAGIPLGITVYDRQGRLVFASEEARIMLALEDLPSIPETVVEDTFVAYEAHSQKRYPLKRLPISQALSGHKGWADDIELHQLDRVIPIEMATTPIFDAQGRVEYAIAAFQDITTRKQAQQVLAEHTQILEQTVAERTAALVEAQRTQRVILDAIPDLLIRYSGEGICLDIMSSGTVDLLAEKELQVGRHISSTMPEAMAAERLHYIRRTLETGQPQVYEYEFETSRGKHYEEARIVISGHNEVLIIVRDITERKRTEAALANQRQFLQSVIDNIPSLITVKDRHEHIQIANQASATLYGTTPEAMVGKLETDINPNLSASEAEHYRRINDQVMGSRQPYQTEQAMTDRAGASRWYKIIVSPFYDGKGEVTGVLGNWIDITDRKAIETELKEANEKLERLATLDGLTQVPNRRCFDQYLKQEWLRMVREQQPLSLILFDVDFFKSYNDHFGHQQGDEALIAVAQAAGRAVKRAADLIARYGGEEFGIVLPNTRRTGAEIVAKTVQAEVAALLIDHPKSKVNEYLTVSIGIASVVPTQDQSPEDLIAAADAALYQAKRRGRNRYWIRLL